MFQHILVPLDLGGGKQRTLAAALQLAQQSQARVTLLHVIQRIEHVPTNEVRDFYKRLTETARDRLAVAARKLAAKKIDVRAVVLLGTPAEAIVKYADTNRVDLIVLPSHKVDLAHPAQGWGTTSYKVGILCQCPVLLIK